MFLSYVLYTIYDSSKGEELRGKIERKTQMVVYTGRVIEKTCVRFASNTHLNPSVSVGDELPCHFRKMFLTRWTKPQKKQREKKKGGWLLERGSICTHILDEYRETKLITPTVNFMDANSKYLMISVIIDHCWSVDMGLLPKPAVNLGTISPPDIN